MDAAAQPDGTAQWTGTAGLGSDPPLRRLRGRGPSTAPDCAPGGTVRRVARSSRGVYETS